MEEAPPVAIVPLVDQSTEKMVRSCWPDSVALSLHLACAARTHRQCYSACWIRVKGAGCPPFPPQRRSAGTPEQLWSSMTLLCARQYDEGGSLPDAA